MHTFYVPGMLLKVGSKEIKMFLSLHNYLSDVQLMQIISGFSLTLKHFLEMTATSLMHLGNGAWHSILSV